MNEDLSQLLIQIAKDQNASCKYFTIHTKLNQSSNYEYANTAGLNHCSSPVYVTAQNPVPICPFYPLNSVCPSYSADISVIQTCVSDSKNLYLSKLRSVDGSYIYITHSDNGEIYNKYTYTDLDAKTNDLDSEAIRLFNLHISEFQLSNPAVELNISELSQEPEKLSYISSLIS